MRLGINVPDKLIKRIKELDPGVNISQVCRETLKSYCRALERINNWIEDYDDEVEEQMMGLSQEPPVEPDWVGYGLEAARDWVRAVEPYAWQSFWYSHDRFKDEAKEPTLPIEFYSRSGVNSFHTRFMENEAWFRPPLAGPTEGDRRDAFDKAHEDYHRAWLGYVNEVRRKQLQYYEEIRNRVLAEREEALKARPEPEVPPQLLKAPTERGSSRRDFEPIS